MSAITATVQLRRDTAANWTANNPTLLAGEVGIETDTRRMKFGNGTQTWTALAYAQGTAAQSNTGDFDAAGSAAAAQAAAIAASQPLDADLTSYANAADAAARRALIGAGTGNGNMVAANNLSDLASASTARTNLGLGTAAVVNTGTGASDVPTITQADARYLRSVIAVLSTTFTTNSAAYVDITGLAVTLDANSTYVVEVMAIVQSSNTATGANVSMTVSGSPTTRTFDRRAFFAPTTAIDAVINTDDGGATTGTTDAANANRPLNMTGLVVTAGSAATIQLRVIRAGSANNISILAGATIIARKVA